jgi:hypothetical protein
MRSTALRSTALRATALRATALRSRGWLWIAVVASSLLGALPARADYYWAIAVGEKRFVAEEDKDYRAERSALMQCVQEFNPALCEVTQKQQGRRGWVVEVVGKLGFYGQDGDRQDRADRSAMQACRAQRQLQNCRVERRSEGSAQSGGDTRGRRPGLEDLFGR